MRLARTFKRDNGNTVTLIALGGYTHATGELELDLFAVSTKNGEQKYHYPDTIPNKSLNGLTVEQYMQHGRTGLLAVLTPGEILAMIQQFRTRYEKAIGKLGI